MKLSLLDMTQSIMSSLGEDEVNSITDTSRSLQVAEILKSTYFNIIARADLPEHRQIFQLEASNDADSPVLMHKPSRVRRIDWIKYNISEVEQPELNTEPSYNYVTILPNEQFMDHINAFDPTQDNVDSMVFNDVTYYYNNDRQPSYCTEVHDHFVMFDSYNVNWDTTLQESKTMCMGHVIPGFTMANDFVPDLDDTQFPLLLNEAKGWAFVELKQTENPRAERESRRQWNTLQRTKHLVKPNPLDQFADFGRVAGLGRRTRWR